MHQHPIVFHAKGVFIVNYETILKVLRINLRRRIQDKLIILFSSC